MPEYHKNEIMGLATTVNQERVMVDSVADRITMARAAIVAIQPDLPAPTPRQLRGNLTHLAFTRQGVQVAPQAETIASLRAERDEGSNDTGSRSRETSRGAARVRPPSSATSAASWNMVQWDPTGSIGGGASPIWRRNSAGSR